MQKINYIHTHSDASNFKSYDSLIRVRDIVTIAKERGNMCFLTDHDTVSNHPSLIKEAKLQGVKYALGNEIYVTNKHITQENYEKGDKFYHLLLIAKNKKGWEMTNELSTHAWRNSFTQALLRTPTYKSFLKEVVSRNKGNLICTTACLGGETAELIKNFHSERTEENKQSIIDHLTFYKDLFGEDFYLEIQPSKQQDQINHNNWLKAFGQLLDIPLVVATDAHYVHKSDFQLHNVFLNSQQKFTKHRETKDFYEYAYFIQPDEIIELLSKCENLTPQDINTAIDNTLKIADKIEQYDINSEVYLMETKERDDNYESLLSTFALSTPSLDKCKTSEYEIDRYFAYLVCKHWNEKLSSGKIENNQLYKDRIEEEVSTFLKISTNIGERLTKYFTTMREIILKIWEVSIVGVGRGSACGSLICYLFDITAINPLKPDKYGEIDELPFWRFLHESRPELPDIDIDSSSTLKSLILKRLSDWAEENNNVLAKVATFGTLKPKNSIKVAARGLGYTDEEANSLSALVVVARGMPLPLRECMEDPLFQKGFAEHKELLDTALRIEGLKVAVGSHAAAIVFIPKSEMFSRCSFLKDKGTGLPVTCFDLNELDELGAAIKYDLLNTSAIDIVQTELNLLVEYNHIEWQGNLKDTYIKYLHPDAIDTKNLKVWENIRNHDVIKLFQYDTPQGFQGIDLVQPQSIVDLINTNSALRLQSESGDLPLKVFADRKKDIGLWYREMEIYGLTKEEIKILEKYLLLSYGMCIDQETIMTMSMGKEIGNFDVMQANALRRAIAKKKPELLEEMHQLLFETSQGVRKEFLVYVWEKCFMLSAGYGFSRLHSTAYSYIAYQQAWLYTTYPSIYWSCSVLMVQSATGSEQLIGNIDLEDDEEVSDKTRDAFKMGSALGEIQNYNIKISPPDVNKSAFGFLPQEQDNSILFGLSGMSGIGNELVQNIIDHRPYNNVEELHNKTKLNVAQVATLIKSGACDIFGDREQLLMEHCERVADTKTTLNMRNINKIVEYNLLPKEYQSHVVLFKLHEYMKKNCMFEEYFVPEENMWRYLYEFDLDIHVSEEGSQFLVVGDFKKYYDKYMLPVKEYIKSEQKELLARFNKIEVDKIVGKYYEETSLGELNSLGCFIGDPYLAQTERKQFLNSIGVSPFNSMPTEPECVWTSECGKYSRFRIARVAITVVGRDKDKNLVVGITPEGECIEVKFYKSSFLKYNNSLIKEDGTKEESWFSRGTNLLLMGYRYAENKFLSKTYKNVSTPVVSKLTIDNGEFLLKSER